jgi:hypothetical protein
VTTGRAWSGLRPSPFSLSRLLGSSRLSAGSVRKAPRTPLLSFASSSEYDRRRLPDLQAGSASFLRVLSPPAHGGTRGPQTRGSQAPIRSPLSVSHALRGLLPPAPSWACPIPLALLGFLHDDPPAPRSLAGADHGPCWLPETGNPKVPGSGPPGLESSEELPCLTHAAPGQNRASGPVPHAEPSGPAGRGEYARWQQPAFRSRAPEAAGEPASLSLSRWLHEVSPKNGRRCLPQIHRPRRVLPVWTSRRQCLA